MAKAGSLPGGEHGEVGVTTEGGGHDKVVVTTKGRAWHGESGNRGRFMRNGHRLSRHISCTGQLTWEHDKVGVTTEGAGHGEGRTVGLVQAVLDQASGMTN